MTRVVISHTRVAELLALGMTNKQIARELQASEGGVKYHISQILAELGTANRTQAALRMRDERAQ